MLAILIVGGWVTQLVRYKSIILVLLFIFILHGLELWKAQ